MIDDYQYKPTPLSPKNQGLFGFGGQPNEGSRGFVSSIEDAGPSRRGGNDFGGGSENNPYSGSAGVQQSYDPFPDAVGGDILYYNGDKWVTLNKPSSDGILSIVGNTPTWITTNRNGSLIYYDENLESWLTIPAPTGSETYVLGFKDSVLQWIQTTDCDQPEET
jgi:hypothetical protein